MIKNRRIEEFVGGWFIGNFRPTLFNTKDFEVSYKIHKKDENVAPHYHKIATEYNLVLEGTININGEKFEKGDVFIIEPFMCSFPSFPDNCSLIVIKVPSAPGDKYEIK